MSFKNVMSKLADSWLEGAESVASVYYGRYIDRTDRESLF